MKNWLEITVEFLSASIELIGGLVILYASIVAAISYFKSVLSKADGLTPGLEVRLSLGRSLAIALELLLGADILKTAIAPTWNEIGQLAAIAAIRTALNFFLERELQKQIK